MQKITPEIVAILSNPRSQVAFRLEDRISGYGEEFVGNYWQACSEAKAACQNDSDCWSVWFTENNNNLKLANASLKRLFHFYPILDNFHE